MEEAELNQYSHTDLEALVRRIMRVIAAKKLDWKIGEPVIFNFQGCVRAGKILKVNRKSVIVECTDGEYGVAGKPLQEMIRGNAS